MNLFETTSIELLKSLYYKSKVYFTDNNFEIEAAYFVRASKQLIESPIILNSFNIIENELKIFRNITLESLKLDYFEMNFKSMNK